MRVVRRDLLENLNKVRREKRLGHLYVDLMTNQVAMDYAAFLNGNAHDMNFFKTLYTIFKVSDWINTKTMENVI